MRTRWGAGRAWAAGGVAVVLAVLGPQAAAAEEILLDGIAAQVGAEVVLVSEVEQMAAPVEKRMREAGVPVAEIAMMRADLLDRLIEMRLIANVVRRQDLGASDEDVNAAIVDIARETGLTLAQLKRSIAGHGLTFEEYRAKIRSEIERTKVVNALVRSRVRIEPSEVRALYAERFGNQHSGGEEVHLRHLVVAFGAEHFRDRGTACALVEDAARRIESGDKTFAELARDISDANARTGGDLGWIHVDNLASWMAPVVATLEPKQVSGVIETRFGCNLLALVERRPFQPVSFETAKPMLEATLHRQRSEEEYAKWVDSLRGQIYVEKKDLGSWIQGKAGGS